MSSRVYRGGSFVNLARNARVSARNDNAPTQAAPTIGFRPARLLDHNQNH